MNNYTARIDLSGFWNDHGLHVQSIDEKSKDYACNMR